MPFIGSASSIGNNIVGAATNVQELQSLVFPLGQQSRTIPLRLNGLSRVTATIVQTAGVAPGTFEFQVRGAQFFQPIVTGGIAAIGVPVTFTQHCAGRDCRIQINPGILSVGTYNILLMATSTS
jgi:hypothetical protein